MFPPSEHLDKTSSGHRDWRLLGRVSLLFKKKQKKTSLFLYVFVSCIGENADTIPSSTAAIFLIPEKAAIFRALAGMLVPPPPHPRFHI